MKYLKTFEAVTDRFLYHFTGNIKKILETNRLNLSSHLGTIQDRSGKFFFTSFSRSPDPFAGYGRLGGDTGYSRIVFDRDKLKHSFKIAPFDYWQQRNVETLPAFGVLKAGKVMNKEDVLKDLKHEINMRNEFEERLISDKPYINNISKYIERIDLIGGEDGEPIQNNNLYEEIQLAKKLGIKVFVYKNKKDMMYAKNNIIDKIKYKETDEKPYVSLYDDPNYDRFTHYEELIALFMFDRKYSDDYDLFKEDLEKYLKVNNLEDLKLDPYKTYDRFRTLLWGSRDFLPSIEADFHNFFKGGHSGRLRNIIGIFIKEMKRLGVKTIREMVDLKVNNLRPKSLRRKDWSSVYQLSKADYDYDEQKYFWKPLSNLEPFKDTRIYYNTWKYGGEVDDDDFKALKNIEEKDQPISNAINYLFNKYVEKKVYEIIEKSSWDNHAKISNYKVIRIQKDSRK